MRPTAGTRLGAYEVIAPLGAGGMGEVYRARDARLGRDVAIKTLPAEVSDDRERLRRFEQEARAVAALRHPAIVTVHEVGLEQGQPFIVMELVEGETLREALAAGALPVRRCLEISATLADALAAAHGAGILHRDLKPENVMLAREGYIKILDFGLAKTSSPVAGSEGETATATQLGVVMGTIGYMSPEQARGQSVDYRTDQFALGLVLYETLTGRRAFRRETPAQTLAAIIDDEPEPIGTLNPKVPLPVRWLVERCLEKDPARRYHSTADLAAELRLLRDRLGDSSLFSASGVAAVATPTPPRARWRQRSLWFAAALGALVAASGGLLLRSLSSTPDSVSREPIRFTVSLPAGDFFDNAVDGPIELSPDGRTLALATSHPTGEERAPISLRLRRLDQLGFQPIEGSGRGPFFDPQGQWLGYFEPGRKLRKRPLRGGDAVTIADVSAREGLWLDDGTIVYREMAYDRPNIAAGTSGKRARFRCALGRVSSTGGESQPLTKLEPDEAWHAQPVAVPGCPAILFTVSPAEAEFMSVAPNVARPWIEALPLKTGRRLGRHLVENAHSPRLAPTGHLLFMREGALFAAPFDCASLTLKGEAVKVVEGLYERPPWLPPLRTYAVSATGTLAYLPGSFERQTTKGLSSFDRAGKETPLQDGDYGQLAVSPDGRWLAAVRRSGEPGLWLLDISRRSWSALSRDPAAHHPVWMPDSRYVLFASRREGKWVILRREVSGLGRDEIVATLSAQPRQLWSVSADGVWLAYGVAAMDANSIQTDVWLLPLSGGGAPKPLLDSAEGDEGCLAFSPDGRWIAYNADGQLFLEPWPRTGRRVQITSCSELPYWRRDSREIIFAEGGGRPRIRAIVLGERPLENPPEAKPLFEPPAGSGLEGVSPDGQRLFAVKSEEFRSLAPAEIVVVVNWTTELSRRMIKQSH